MTAAEGGAGPPPRTALVLAGGAARGAYEVGIIDHILTEVSRDLGVPVRIDILCGTSVGAINACVLAAFPDQPAVASRILLEEWTKLRLEDLLRFKPRELLSVFGTLAGRTVASGDEGIRKGGLVDPSGIEQIVARAIPFHRIEENIQGGRLTGLSISTTHVATGRTFVFVRHSTAVHPRWSRDATIRFVSSPIAAEHALASAALPMLFPAVRIDGDYFCDGGLRQNVPLSPARRLGADGLIVVNPRYIAPAAEAEETERRARAEGEPAAGAGYPGFLFLMGKALNALLLDRIDNDVDRLERINAILDAGTRRYGADFLRELNASMFGPSKSNGLKPLRTVHIRASEDIGKLAAEYTRSSAFAARNRGLLGRALRSIAEWQGEGEADLLSYLLFDGRFAEDLIALGRHDAKARHEELCGFFARGG